ncbi:hypothetical protein [Limibacillus halophilus]|uniref:Uncharacterized protein n=1 Tax=Limibacillus halophilus TaxID=1579333 RepID=A0A839SSL8_9PROT|nr:hypothetical protein [Limibacillus halophilus]MBB3064979.1 hypothetical protein [Limibacillus halophilus]
MSKILNVGDKVYIITRRHFPQEVRRHFIGEVQSVQDTAIRASGYTFIFDESRNTFVRKPELRVRVFGTTDSGLIVNIISNAADLEAVSYHANEKGNVVCTDGKYFSLDVNEFTSSR